MGVIAWRTIGNERALESLEKAVLSGTPAHAYLFCGPASVGKLRAAVEFAAVLNCEGEVRPCRECRSCRDTFSGHHPDVELIAPGGICDESEHRDHSDSRDLRICQVRRLERVLSLTPYAGGWRIAIIDAADSLRTEAANAFLKTLEEPPERTVIVLVTDSEDRLPETVLSRCQRVVFQRVDRATVLRALGERGADARSAAAIATTANGRIGWAFRVLEDATLLSERDEMLDTAVRVTHGSRSERFLWARGADERGSSSRERYQRELHVWETWWRDVLSVSSGAREGLTNTERRFALEQESKLYSPADVITFLRRLLEVREILKGNVDPQLALEVLTLDLPRPRAAAASGSR